ncbi:MAG: hypothetical protein ABII00_09460 [Elusimicrobiota bacterium]
MRGAWLAFGVPFALASVAAVPGHARGPSSLERDWARGTEIFDGGRLLPRAVPVRGALSGAADARPARRLDPRVSLLLRAEAFNRKEPVWPGYSVLGQPILLYEGGERSTLIGHPSPPPGYRTVRGRPAAIYQKEGPVPGLQGAFNFHRDVNGVDTFAYRFESGSAPAEDLATIIHERFHVHQETSFSQFPYGHYYGVADARDLALAKLEHSVLGRALLASDNAVSARYARMFVAVRRARYAEHGDAARPVEDSQEQSEGMARYVELKLTAPPGLGGRGRAWLIGDLDRPVTLKDMGKWRLYATGAAQGYLLDRARLDGWKEAVQDGTSLFYVTTLAYPVDPSREPGLVQSAKREFDYPALLAEAEDEIEGHSREKQAAVRMYESQPGLELILPHGPRPIPTYFSGGGETYSFDDGSSLITRMKVIEQRGTDYSLIVEDRPAILGPQGMTRFHIPETASLVIDGRASVLAPGVYPFRSLRMSAPGFELSADIPGTLTVDDDRVRVEWQGRHQGRYARRPPPADDTFPITQWYKRPVGASRNRR